MNTKLKSAVKISLISLIALCFIALVTYGVIYFSQKLGGDAQTANGIPDSPAKKHTLTAMKAPENNADVLDNLAYAITENQDAVAWLKVPNTDINNIVMQGDDNDFYLRRDENKEHDVYGCYFLDYECGLGKREDFSQNVIIYGHSELTDNKDGKRFAQLYRFVDDEFAKANPYIFLTTPEGEFVYEIFSAFYTDTGFDYIKVHTTQEEILNIAQKAKELSIRDYGKDITKEDKLLTLSTCTAKFEDDTHRFVVMGKMLGDDAAKKILVEQKAE